MAAAAAADPPAPGYFVGHPLHYQAAAVDDQNAVNEQVPGYYSGGPSKPLQIRRSEPESEPVDGQVYASVPGGYYSGGPSKSGASGQGSSAAPKESGFFASCCACFSGGKTAR